MERGWCCDEGARRLLGEQRQETYPAWSRATASEEGFSLAKVDLISLLFLQLTGVLLSRDLCTFLPGDSFPRRPYSCSLPPSFTSPL